MKEPSTGDFNEDTEGEGVVDEKGEGEGVEEYAEGVVDEDEKGEEDAE